MSKEQRNVPKLRFPEFTDEWEERKFANIAQRQSETIVSDDENPCVEYEDVVAERGVLNKDIYAKGVYKNGIKFTSEDVLYGKLRPYLHNWLNPYFSGVAVGDWWVLRPVNTDKDFLYWMIQTAKYDNVANQSAGTKMPRADWKLVSNLEFHVPISRAEQKTIADFLTKFDTLISLQQRKLDQIKEYKKGMLQKMFPKEDESVPEVRFPGFSGKWERHNLTDFVEFYSGLTYTPSDVRENGTLVLRSSNVKNGEIVNADNVYVEPSKATSDNVKRGDIIVVVRNGSRALIGKHAMIKESKPDTVIGAFMTGIRSQYSSFVNALLDTRQFEKEVEKNMGATINQITGYMFAQMMFYVPVPEEQRKIGEFFSDIDTLITLHQRKLDAMKEYKKGLLQQMFV